MRGFTSKTSTQLISILSRMGGARRVSQLDGSEGVNDCYICEIAPGKSLDAQKHMFEELIYVVSGRGATTVCKTAAQANFRVG